MIQNPWNSNRAIHRVPKTRGNAVRLDRVLAERKHALAKKHLIVRLPTRHRPNQANRVPWHAPKIRTPVPIGHSAKKMEDSAAPVP